MTQSGTLKTIFIMVSDALKDAESVLTILIECITPGKHYDFNLSRQIERIIEPRPE